MTISFETLMEVISRSIGWVLYPWNNWGLSFNGTVIPFWYILVGCFLFGFVVACFKWLSGSDFIKVIGIFFGG